MSSGQNSNSRTQALVTVRGLADAFAGIAMPLAYAWFAYIHLANFFHTGRASVALITAFETSFALTYAFRRRASATSFRLRDWVTTTGGTLLPLLLRPTAAHVDDLVGEGIQVIAALLCIWAILSLNRRIGLLPANRGICTTGPYQLVRHPLYSAYTLGQLGYLMSNFTAQNTLVVATAFAFQLLRVAAEERLLTDDNEYRAYSARTRWRIAPFVF